MITALDLAPIVLYNPTLAHPLFVALLSICENATLASPFLHVLCSLPPTLSTFDLMGRLLQDGTVCGQSRISIAALVKSEVLGRFTLECINWLDIAENQEREGQISDDRFTTGVKHVRAPFHLTGGYVKQSIALSILYVFGEAVAGRSYSRRGHGGDGTLQPQAFSI